MLSFFRLFIFIQLFWAWWKKVLWFVLVTFSTDLLLYSKIYFSFQNDFVLILWNIFIRAIDITYPPDFGDSLSFSFFL